MCRCRQELETPRPWQCANLGRLTHRGSSPVSAKQLSWRPRGSGSLPDEKLQGTSDKHILRLSASGEYIAKSA